MKKVTQKQADFVLKEVAKWLGDKGMGEPKCPERRTLGRYMTHEDDGSMCLDCTFGPAPTGPEAAYKGIGPELRMDWDYPGTPTPTVILESGYAPEDWAIRCCYDVQKALDAKEIPVMVEPYFSFALSMYRDQEN